MGRPWRSVIVGVGVVVVAALSLAGCTTVPDAPDVPLPSGRAPLPPAPAPGTLLEAEEVAPPPSLADLGARMWQVRYASRAVADDAPIEVTGAVIEPGGEPPPGGWPLVSYAHGTTGLADPCAPSRSPTLLGQLAVVLPLIERGFAITATDYEGLGTPGPHPYLQPVSEARGVIDAVTAARELLPRAGDRWAALGLSQGGQATWATAELGGAGFLGAAALAPATVFDPLIDAVPDELSPVEQRLYAAVLLSAQQRHPSLDLADYLSGDVLAAVPDVAAQCLAPIVEPFPADGFVPSSSAALEQLRGWLAEWALPSRAAAGPLFVAAGTADDLVPVGTVDEAVAEACSLGTVVEYRRYEGAGHPALPAAAEDSLRWITSRFAGEPPPSTCA